jgi:hypothetical protein
MYADDLHSESNGGAGALHVGVSWPSIVEGGKRLGIAASILVSRHLKTTEDLVDNRSSPRTESMIAAAIQWTDRILTKIDNAFPPK